MLIFRCNTLFFALCSICIFSACDMDKEIDVPLPGYAQQPVVEAYLDANNNFKVLLTNTSSYFDSPMPTPVQGAVVTITYNGQTDTLTAFTSVAQQYDSVTRQFYNYGLPYAIPVSAGQQFALMVKLPDGKTITGTTLARNAVPIDTIKFTGEPGKLTLTTYLHDPGGEENYYRFLVHRNTTAGPVEDDDLGSDRLTNGKYNSFFTSDKFKTGDTLVVTLYSLEPGHFEFIRSVDDAENANGNPFAQPAAIRSTVSGGLGVFTSLSYDRKYLIVP